jgi:ketosteroid isomerase-like protein
MSRESVEVVGAAYEAFAERGVDGFLEYLTEDVDHRAIEGAPDDRGPMHGREASRAYVQDWLDTFDGFTARPVELIDAGENQVVAVVRISGRASPRSRRAAGIGDVAGERGGECGALQDGFFGGRLTHGTAG